MDSSRKRYEGYAGTVIGNLAEEWQGNQDTSRPFCLLIGHKATHRTRVPETVDFGRFDKVHFPLPKTFYDNYATRSAAARQDMTIAHTVRMGHDLKMFESDEAASRKGRISRMNPAQRAAFEDYYKPIDKDLKKKRNLRGNALIEWKFQRYLRDYLSTAASLDRDTGYTLDHLASTASQAIPLCSIFRTRTFS